MPQENITSTFTASAVESANNQHKVISENIQVNHPITFSFYSFRPRKLYNGTRRRTRVTNAFIIFRKVLTRELKGHINCSKSEFSRFVAKKWVELSNDDKRVYYKACLDINEYYAFIELVLLLTN
jgi:hypothetical protein